MEKASTRNNRNRPINRQDGFTRPIGYGPSSHRGGVSHNGGKSSGKMQPGSIPKKFDDPSLVSNSPLLQQSSFSVVKGISSDMRNLKLVENSPQSDPRDGHLRKEQRGKTSHTVAGSHVASQSTQHFVVPSARNDSLQTDESIISSGPSTKGTQYNTPFHKSSSESLEPSNSASGKSTFDICQQKSGTPFQLKAPLLVKNREKRNEIKRAREGHSASVLRPGMVLLKSYLSCEDQVKIVKTCQALGLGSGGFYEPGYRDGAKLHLKMMCLGKNWDPETSKYGDVRPSDDAKPPDIPDEFHQLVKIAIQDSHAFLHKQLGVKDVEHVLPSMLPNICIVNFYASSGKLGLHQDKDERPESLRKQLPVVSFSVGDSAEFLYGDQRDVDKADKVILESGDVLIFGGKSRLIFHGVTGIHQNTAPKALLEGSNLRPGRLNLTFREY